MPTQLVRWRPVSAPNIIAYKLLCSDTGADGPFLELITVLNLPSGLNWDASAGVYFYTDVEIPYRLYRLWTIDSYGNTYGDTTAVPFGPNNDPVDAPISNVYPLDENTNGTAQFQYVTPGGSPIADATIRVYTKIAWDTKQYSQVVGVTSTTPAGNWKMPIFVEPGNTYTVVFHKPNEWGPNAIEVTV